MAMTSMMIIITSHMAGAFMKRRQPQEYQFNPALTSTDRGSMVSFSG
jgi:hypothetical protein